MAHAEDFECLCCGEKLFGIEFEYVAITTYVGGCQDYSRRLWTHPECYRKYFGEVNHDLMKLCMYCHKDIDLYNCVIVLQSKDFNHQYYHIDCFKYLTGL